MTKKYWKLHKVRTIMGLLFGLIIGIAMYFIPNLRIYPTNPIIIIIFNTIILSAFAVFWFNFGD